MAKTYKKIINDKVEGSFELDLAPMLALMVCLIPIMLLATVFVRVTLIETPLPQVVQEAMQRDEADKDKKVLISLQMDNKRGFQLKVSRAGQTLSAKQIPLSSNREWDLTALHKELVDLKKAYPDVFRLEISPGEEVAYDHIVKVIDEARNSREGEPKFEVTGDDGKKGETDLMFPNVYFANVMEG